MWGDVQMQLEVKPAIELSIAKTYLLLKPATRLYVSIAHMLCDNV